MFKKEDIDSWNGLFPDCKMRETDVSQPTETFLTTALTAYLRTFGYKVEISSSSEDSTRERRLFHIKLARNIDRILKITDKSYAFTYCDLIQPSPKKTSHMFGILLNYLFYFNMYKTEVFDMANKRLDERQMLQERIQMTQNEIEERKIRTEEVKEEILQLTKEVNVSQSEEETLKAHKCELRDKLLKLQEVIKELNIEKRELHSQRRNVEQQKVSDEEATNLKVHLSKLQENIKESKHLKTATEKTLKERKEHTNALQELLKSINHSNEIMPLKLLETYNEMDKQLNDLKTECAVAEQRKENLLQMIVKQEAVLKSFDEKLKKKKSDFKLEKSTNSQSIISKEKKDAALTEELSQLKNDEHILVCQLQEQKDICNFLQEGIAVLFNLK